MRRAEEAVEDEPDPEEDAIKLAALGISPRAAQPSEWRR
jgi:hypothetical protein